MSSFLESCKKIVGQQYVITDERQILPFVTDYRKRFTGRALAVIKPANTQEVAKIVALCKENHVPIVPQGGNTGLVLGSIPDQSGKAIVLSLTRLNQIHEVDAFNNTMTVDSGCLLENIHRAAKKMNRIFPLSLPSSGSCTIGGNLATNAGGTNVLRYGTARHLCLGLEVVTGEGEIWDGIRGLRKDNMGYDLRDLFIGSEGTLGIITKAVLALYPEPKVSLTAFASVSSVHNAMKLLEISQKTCYNSLTGFELISKYALELVLKHFPNLKAPFDLLDQQYILLEISDYESEEHAISQFEMFLNTALEKNIISNVAIAQSIAQSQEMWQLRENISAAQALESKNIKHDIAIPTSFVPEFIETTDQLLQKHFPNCKMVTFGHLGDGSLHYNVAHPPELTNDAFLELSPKVNRVVYDSVHQFHGTVSAEHGLGMLKRNELMRYKSPIEIKFMKKIKTLFDPYHIMNPGKILE